MIRLNICFFLLFCTFMCLLCAFCVPFMCLYVPFVCLLCAFCVPFLYLLCAFCVPFVCLLCASMCLLCAFFVPFVCLLCAFMCLLCASMYLLCTFFGTFSVPFRYLFGTTAVTVPDRCQKVPNVSKVPLLGTGKFSRCRGTGWIVVSGVEC